MSHAPANQAGRLCRGIKSRAQLFIYIAAQTHTHAFLCVCVRGRQLYTQRNKVRAAGRCPRPYKEISLVSANNSNFIHYIYVADRRPNRRSRAAAAGKTIFDMRLCELYNRPRAISAPSCIINSEPGNFGFGENAAQTEDETQTDSKLTAEYAN
jgi:hypothetical protein